jgi:hypothetical protein
MYGLPRSLIQFGRKPAAKKRGRLSAWSKFLEQQKDLFPVDLYTAKLSQAARLGGREQAAARSEARTAARSAAFPPATNRGGKSQSGEGIEADGKENTNSNSDSYERLLCRE